MIGMAPLCIYSNEGQIFGALNGVNPIGGLRLTAIPRKRGRRRSESSIGRDVNPYGLYSTGQFIIRYRLVGRETEKSQRKS